MSDIQSLISIKQNAFAFRPLGKFALTHVHTEYVHMYMVIYLGKKLLNSMNYLFSRWR